MNELKLITIFDVPDLYTLLSRHEKINKYWLFRYKIVTVKFKQNDKDGVKNAFIDLDETQTKLCNSLCDNLELQFTNLDKHEKIKLKTVTSFTSLIKGSVGILEHLLEWN